MADHPQLFDEIDRKVRVKFGLLEESEEESAMAVASEETDDLALDLDNGIEIED